MVVDNAPVSGHIEAAPVGEIWLVMREFRSPCNSGRTGPFVYSLFNGPGNLMQVASGTLVLVVLTK